MEENGITQEELSEILRVRRQKLADLRASDMDPYQKTRYNKTHNAKEIVENFEALEGKMVCIAGRLMSRRIMGKASFGHVLDGSGQIQIYVRVDGLGAEPYTFFKKMLDIGDIVGVEGEVFKTNKGEISVKATKVELLSKSLLPLPEKFHGLKDPDLRYRQRYVDLIVNPEVRETFVIRSKIMKLIRNYMDNRGYLEVETPILHTLATGSAAKPFITHHNTLDVDMYLRIETELGLKRLIVGGFEKVYEIGRIFRNEGMDPFHNPEFTTMEFYEAYTDMYGMMELVEGLYETIAKELYDTTEITYQGKTIELKAPWKRMTMKEAVKHYSGFDFDAMSVEEILVEGRKRELEVEPGMSKGQMLPVFFDEYCEDKLIQPTFITDYPIEISPLAKKYSDDPSTTRRFELFICGKEMGNAFSELNDPIDQRARFVEQAEKKMAGEGEAQIDEDFVTALEYGMPPTGGMGIGIDRMVMLFTDSYSIRDVLLFPTMKPR